MHTEKNIILGAGLTGLSAAYHLEEDSAVFEKNSEIGGLARSEEVDGYLFDYAPHILYTVNPCAEQMIKDLLKDNLVIKKRKAFIYHLKHKLYTQFPFQAHLYGLPNDVILDCLKGLAEVIRNPDKKRPDNYEEWIYQRFGRGIAEHLMIPYSERIWTISPKGMNYDWIDRRVPTPDFSRVLDGALKDTTSLEGFNNDFWYPVYGGIESLPTALAEKVENIHLNKKASRIRVDQKNVEFADKTALKYERLISTLPLPVIVEMLDDTPDNVKQAARALQHNSIVCVNLGVDRDNISPYHWLYFYEKDFIFHRLSFPMTFSDNVAPRGKSSLCCEIAYSKFRPLEVKGKANIIKRTIDDLIKAGILREDDNIPVRDILSMKYAYVIYDLDHRKNVDTIHGFLHSKGIYPCGRFGEWEYFNMDHSILSGKRTAEKINAEIRHNHKTLSAGRGEG